MFATLKTLVLKTATVTGVKLATPADRIGLGFGVAYPTDNLSPNPASEQDRPRAELSDMQVQQQLQVGSDAVPPAGSAGCLGAPGVSASRSASFPASSFPSWQLTMRAAAASRTNEFRSTAVLDRAHLPGDSRHDDRLGRDCQSPRRLRDKRVATREVVSAATAGK